MTDFGNNAGYLPGSRIVGYRLDEAIGRGGMAIVFRAFDESLNRQVAVKIPAPELALDEDFRQRLIRESQLAAQVDHPHIIPVFAADEAGGRAVHRDAVRAGRQRRRQPPAVLHP